ncbi:hypothetical protein SO802_022401 [Lithocarpus litseifolius]|uniref:PARG catalytic Macro domain-containing protein n=1 Tax=Lithocarpus litseifolius TaxID=425828 RepID=A0AAW2CHP8_9ROSI
MFRGRSFKGVQDRRLELVSPCAVAVRNPGLIEDQSIEALEVDLENKFIGGGPLDRGCVSWKTLVLRLLCIHFSDVTQQNESERKQKGGYLQNNCQRSDEEQRTEEELKRRTKKERRTSELRSEEERSAVSKNEEEQCWVRRT